MKMSAVIDMSVSRFFNPGIFKLNTHRIFFISNFFLSLSLFSLADFFSAALMKSPFEIYSTLTKRKMNGFHCFH